MVTVNRIAATLGISSEETIRLLKQHSISVVDADSVLKEVDLKKLSEVIQEIKVGNVSQIDQSETDREHNFLESYVKECKIFIDTCSLLTPHNVKFWENIIPILKETGNRVIIPTRAMDEIIKHSKNNNKPKLQQQSLKVLEALQQLKQEDLVEFRGEETDNFADNVFQVVFTKFRMTHKLLLITQDKDLASDILNLNNIKSVKAKQVHVKRINQRGYLSNFRVNILKGSDIKSRGPRRTQTQQESDEQMAEIEGFILAKQLTNVPDKSLTVAEIPDENGTAYVYSNNKYTDVKLYSKVASGGEGSIFTTNTPYVAKIYKEEKLNQRKYEKIKLMLSKEIQCEGICYPVACLYNAEEQFVGYLMPKAEGQELQKSLFIKPLFIKKFPTWKKKDTVQLCITILEKIKYLHDRNIIMGDINPANILVVSPKQVYFVDTDSYQIEGFPCPVGTVNYTAPEIQRKKFDTFLRSFGNENFAIATLLFMIMLPGKPPYSQQGGESPVDNIVNMDFSYPFGEQSNKKTPDGPWRYIWSHMTYDIKESFYHTFRKDGKTSEEETRLSVDEWLSKFKYYLRLLEDGKLRGQDEMSEELFPTRHKKNAKITYEKCTLCGMEVPEETRTNGICKQCLKKGEVYRCKRCGKEILYTNYQKYIKNTRKYDICQECFNYNREVYQVRTCVICGQDFEIKNGEANYMQDNGQHLPKRCSVCRKNKQTSRPMQTAYTRSTTTTHTSSTKKNSGRKRGSLCFITTAVCAYFNKPDDCYELTILRYFRDEWLRYQPEGETLIEEYYEVAPAIVEALEKATWKDSVYQELWQDYISKCITYIEEDEFEACKVHYIAMIEMLKQKLSN